MQYNYVLWVQPVTGDKTNKQTKKPSSLWPVEKASVAALFGAELAMVFWLVQRGKTAEDYWCRHGTF